MQLRKAGRDDLGFVLETFLRSIRGVSTHVEDLDNDTIVRLMTNLLANGWTASVVEAEGLLIAWAVWREGNRLAWSFVKPFNRGDGVWRWMLGELGIDRRKPIVSPFVPNKEHDRRLTIRHRPFECVARQ